MNTDIKLELTKALFRKINSSPELREYRSKYARKQLIKIARETVKEFKVTGPDKGKWLKFCQNIFKKG